MATSLDKLTDDLARLVRDGDELGAVLEVYAGNRSTILDAYPDEAERARIGAWLDTLPRFPMAYEGWFSEAPALVGQLLPDRLADVRGHFEDPRPRKDLDPEAYRIHDAPLGLRATRTYDGSEIVGIATAIPHVEQQRALPKAARRRVSSRVFDRRRIVQADLYDSELDAAGALAARSFTRAAGPSPASSSNAI